MYFLKNSSNKDHTNFLYLVTGHSITVSLNILTGKRNHHFEMDFGLHLLIDESAAWVFVQSENNSPAPDQKKSKLKAIANFGYRYQKPQGGLMIKIFAGLFGVGIDLGYAF